MYGLSDAMRENERNLYKLDRMVTIAKKALKEIAKASKDDKIKLIASSALLKIMEEAKKD